MKAVIIAGGKGTRMANGHVEKIKPLVEINKTPIIIHIISYFIANGINEIIICTGYKHEMIMMLFNSINNVSILSSDEESEIFFNHTQKTTIKIIKSNEEFGTSGRLMSVKSYIKPGDIFLVCYCDNLIDLNIKKLIEKHMISDKICTIVACLKEHRFGIIEKKGNNNNFIEKPNILTNTSYYIFKYNVFDFMDNKFSYIESDILTRLSKENEINILDHDGAWRYMDNPEEALRLNFDWKNLPFIDGEIFYEKDS